jgi:ABC-type taurine transport system substrate-binding protein
MATQASLATSTYMWRMCSIAEWCWIPHLDVFVVKFNYRNTIWRVVCDVYSRLYGDAQDLYKWSRERWKDIDYYLDAIWC